MRRKDRLSRPARRERLDAGECSRLSLNGTGRLPASHLVVSDAGVSLVEMLLMVTMVAIILAIGVPALNQQMVRGRLVGACEQVATHLHNARLEAMKKGFPVVVEPDYETQRMVAFLDDQVQNLTQDPGEDTLFDLAVPGDMSQSGVYFMGPDLVMATPGAPAESIEGLTSAGGPYRVAVFEPNGSIRDLGAFRFGDGKTPRANIFEVRIEPAATARIEIRKWIYGGAGGGGADVFLPAGGGTWTWY